MRCFYILLSTFFFGFHAWAQHTSNLHEQYQFKALTIDNGLSNNRVRTMAQDQYGFLWMGTRKGISRYDGHSFKNYTTFFVNDTTSEGMLEMRESVYDMHGNLWFGGYNGLLKYNIQKDRFERILLTDDAVVRNCMGMAQDSKDSTLWFTFSDRLVHYNIKNNSKEAFVHDPTDSLYTPPSQQMERTTLDSKGNLWVIALQQGLISFNKSSGTFTFYKATGRPGALADSYVEKVYEDPKGKIWVSYRDKGLSLYDPITHTFKTFFPDPMVKQSGRVRGLLVDTNGNFWVGTQNGMYLFDPEKETFLHYASMSHPKSRLSHNSIYFFFLDKHQNLWMGTHAGGVCYTNLNTSGFTKYEYSPISNNYFLNDNNVFALAVDDKNNIWIGTGSGGLNYIERKTGKFKYYVNNVNDKNSIPGNDIKVIVIRKNLIWISIPGVGLVYLDTNTDKFYVATSVDGSKLPSNVTSIAFDPRSENILWVGTESGLSLWDIQAKKFIHMVPGALPGIHILEGMNKHKVSSIVVIDQDRLAFAMDGIYILDYQNKAVTRTNKFQDTEIGDTQFAYMDYKGALWVASTHNILYRMDLKTNSLNMYTTRQGLPDVEMYGGLGDDDGNLWVSSNNGLYRFRNLINKPGELIVDRFDRDDNLQSVEFNFGAYAKGLHNELLFGGISGFNSFNPLSIKKNPYKPFVHITNLMIGNKVVEIGQQIAGKVVLVNSILNTNELELDHRTKAFTFTFNAIHYSAPESNQLAYKLEGYDEDWTYLKGSEGTATYTSIPPGNYTFRVKGANNDNLWNEEGDSIVITVPTPFYKTIWFYILVTLLLGVVVYWIIKMRTKKLNEDKKTLQRAIDEKTSEVDAVKQEILRNDEANKIKNWLNSNLKEFGITANKSKEDITTLTRATLIFFNKSIGAQIGTILLLNDTDPDDIFLENVMAAEIQGNEIRRRIKPGEGLVGACFNQGESKLLKVIPPDYIKISSGLGSAPPKNLLLVPIKLEDKVLGVVELSSFTEFLPHYIELVENVIESLASTLFIMKTNQITQVLLHQTREQTEQLQAQEEEMRQNMEELEATTESYKRRELELEARIEQLTRKKPQ